MAAMITALPDPQIFTAENPHNDPLVNRISQFLDQHPEIRREELVRDALEHEIETLEIRDTLAHTPPTEQEVQDHAWVEARMSKLRRPHRSFGERLRGLFNHD